jgi:hypothetical protein
MFLPRDWTELLREFNAVEARYLVVGAAALATYGVIRGTDDFDVWIERSPENAKAVHRALAAFGAPLDDLDVEDLQSPELIFQIGVKPLRIDIITDIDGVDFQEAWAHRVVAEDGELAFPVISRSHLIANKKAAARPKDLLDVESLEKQSPDSPGTR